MKILDSDFLISLLKKEESTVRKSQELKEEDVEVGSTVLCAQEVLLGAKGEKYRVAKELLASMPIVEYDSEAMEEAIRIIYFLTKKGRPIGLFDSMIAGICLAHRDTLLTRNLSHFKQVPLLKVETW